MREYSSVEFRDLIEIELNKNKANNYTDNWDHSIFGLHKEVQTLKSWFKPLAVAVMPRRMYNNLVIKKYLGDYIDGLSYLHNQLENTASRDILLKILAFRIAGHKKIKLLLNNAKYWKNLEVIRGLAEANGNIIDIPYMKAELRKFNLASLGYPISLYFMPFGIMADFVIKQYVYEEGDVVIKAEKNNIVIDAGACWGDTALFFSHEVGDKGMVYSFEFVPSNIEIFQKNLCLNPDLLKRIELVERPIWNQSNLDVYYTNSGPGSFVSMIEFENYYAKTKTLSIDDLVKERSLPSVDFIKMDIEGAEPFAMEGAKETIMKYKPKLAISIYHDLEHFSSILKFIQSLNLGYKFYLKHATIHSYETILFAKAD